MLRNPRLAKNVPSAQPSVAPPLTRSVTPETIVCHRCQKPVLQGQCKEANGQKYHADCFCCKKCAAKFVANDFAKIDDELYCLPCAKAVFAARKASRSPSPAASPKPGVPDDKPAETTPAQKPAEKGTPSETLQTVSELKPAAILVTSPVAPKTSESPSPSFDAKSASPHMATPEAKSVSPQIVVPEAKSTSPHPATPTKTPARPLLANRRTPAARSTPTNGAMTQSMVEPGGVPSWKAKQAARDQELKEKREREERLRREKIESLRQRTVSQPVKPAATLTTAPQPAAQPAPKPAQPERPDATKTISPGIEIHTNKSTEPAPKRAEQKPALAKTEPTRTVLTTPTIPKKSPVKPVARQRPGITQSAVEPPAQKETFIEQDDEWAASIHRTRVRQSSKPEIVRQKEPEEEEEVLESVSLPKPILATWQFYAYTFAGIAAVVLAGYLYHLFG